jgi:ribonuclease HI
MKKLKLDHNLAQLVLSGKKTSTWRLYDDKDLTVNDQLELVDKVDPTRPATWIVIGTARINRIIEKRLGAIQPEDYEGHEVHVSPEERLQVYRGYYGDQVNWDTPVKMVYFDFSVRTADTLENAGQPTDSSEGQASLVSSLAAKPHRSLIGERVTLYADGGSRGNPGPSASGFVILDEAGEILIDKGAYLGVTTNNQAEYHALKTGLEEAKAMGAREVAVRMDSLLVVNQMKGVFKVKNRDLWPVHDAIKQLAANFRKISFTHVPRELNKLADTAVNRVLDEAATSRKHS